MNGSTATLATWCWPVLSLMACSPALNWREVRPPNSGVLAMFPCKPAHEMRRVPLAGPPVSLAIQACSTGEVTYALSYADVGDPTRVGPALQSLRAAVVSNVSGRLSSQRPLQIPGMTPHPEAVQFEVQGHLPNGSAVKERAAVFSKGTRVFQATVFGAPLDAEASETFFGGLRLP